MHLLHNTDTPVVKVVFLRHNLYKPAAIYNSWCYLIHVCSLIREVLGTACDNIVSNGQYCLKLCISTPTTVTARRKLDMMLAYMWSTGYLQATSSLALNNTIQRQHGFSGNVMLEQLYWSPAEAAASCCK